MSAITRNRAVRIAAVVLAVAAIAVAVALSVTAGGRGARPAEFIAADTAIDVKPGQEFTITLDSNATTGYSWKLAADLDGKVIELLGSRYVEPASNALGAAGKEVWSYRAAGAGKATIVLAYAQPWDTTSAPAQTAEFSVTVK